MLVTTNYHTRVYNLKNSWRNVICFKSIASAHQFRDAAVNNFYQEQRNFNGDYTVYSSHAYKCWELTVLEINFSTSRNFQKIMMKSTRHVHVQYMVFNHLLVTEKIIQTEIIYFVSYSRNTGTNILNTNIHTCNKSYIYIYMYIYIYIGP